MGVAESLNARGIRWRYPAHRAPTDGNLGPDVLRTAPLEIPGDEIHFCQAELTAVRSGGARWREIISDDEQTRADGFRFAIDRQNFMAARALLRIRLGAYAGLAGEAVTFLRPSKASHL